MPTTLSDLNCGNGRRERESLSRSRMCPPHRRTGREKGSQVVLWKKIQPNITTLSLSLSLSLLSLGPLLTSSHNLSQASWQRIATGSCFGAEALEITGHGGMGSKFPSSRHAWGLTVLIPAGGRK